MNNFFEEEFLNWAMGMGPFPKIGNNFIKEKVNPPIKWHDIPAAVKCICEKTTLHNTNRCDLDMEQAIEDYRIK